MTDVTKGTSSSEHGAFLQKDKDEPTDTMEDLEELVSSIGGHGPFQFFVWTVGFGTKAAVAGVLLFMSFAGTTPNFWCEPANGTNGSLYSDDEQGLTSVWPQANDSHLYKTCEFNGTSCSVFRFDDSMNTIVNEWSLVCDQKWVSTTITSVQMVGVLLGSFTAGQVADIWGRRKASLVIIAALIIFSLINAFSPNWIVFIITRFGAGFSGGGYLVPYISLCLEFTDIQWRAFLGAIPAWPLGTILMALAAWLLHDWQYLGIAIAAFSLPFFVGWWFMPESVRWLLVHERVDEAHALLVRGGRWNGRTAPDIHRVQQVARREVAKSKSKSNRTYTFADLFRTRDLAIRCSLLFFLWFCIGTVFYFMAFAAETLSGNLYLNIFLLGIVDIPAKFLSAFLNNKIGRRWTGFTLFLAAGLCAVTVIILIHSGAPGSAINGVVLAGKLAMGGGWSGLIVFTVESFPTVIRNIGNGACNVASRVGAVVAPQLVFLSDTRPSVPYAIVAVLMIGSSIAFLKIRETKDLALEDVLPVPAPKTFALDALNDKNINVLDALNDTNINVLDALNDNTVI